MKSRFLKTSLFLGLIVILAILYVWSGETYYTNVGFGGPSITLRLGSFSYQHSSDIGSSGYSVGFAKLSGNRFKLTPIHFLSTEGPFFESLRDPFIKIKCGERSYLVQENHQEDFIEWSNNYELAVSSSSMMQPYFILKGDEKKEFDSFSIPT